MVRSLHRCSTNAIIAVAKNLDSHLMISLCVNTERKGKSIKIKGANQLKQHKIKTDTNKKKDTYYLWAFSLSFFERIDNLINVDVTTYLRETIKTGK